MRTIRLTAVAASLAALSACSEPVQPGGDLQPAPRSYHDIGTYIGTGTAFDTVIVSSETDPENTERGSGYGGSGH